jgi:glycosyltransferase involved in cell wall biosynthesis
MSPLITVIIPAYNSERFVAEAVRSALDQDYPSTEILVIDDGSTDNTLGQLASFDSDVRVVSVPNGGPARARNLGMSMARGEFIAFLDADDVWARGKLSAQVHHLQAHPETGVCYTGWHVWQADADGRWSRPTPFVDDIGLPSAVPDRSGWIYGDLIFECKLLTTTVMLRTEVARSAGEFDLGLRVGEDYDYWLRLSQITRIDRLDCCGALYRVVPGSASRRPHVLNHELIVVQRALARFGGSCPSGHSVSGRRIKDRLHQLAFQHAWAHLRNGDPSVALGGFQACLARRPWSVALWARWLQALRLKTFGAKPLPSQ